MNLSKKIIFGGLFKAWLGTLAGLVLLFIWYGLFGGLEHKEIKLGELRYLVGIMAVFGFISFIAVFAGGFLLLWCAEKMQWRKWWEYLLLATASCVFYPIAMPFAWIAAFILWKTVAKKYFIVRNEV